MILRTGTGTVKENRYQKIIEPEPKIGTGTVPSYSLDVIANCLTSSSVTESTFSLASLSSTKRRTRVSDSLFEAETMLKANKLI